MRRYLVCLALPLAVALPAASLTIDNFEEGITSATDTQITGATFTETTGLLGSNTIGGSRLVRIETTGSVLATGSAVGAPTPAPDDGVTLSTAGVPDGTSEFAFIYDGIANNDLDGPGGALNLDLSAFSHIAVTTTALSVAASTQLTLWSSSGFESSAITPLVNGVSSFSLGSFAGLDLADVQAIRLSILGIDNGELPIINDISAIPEPGSGSLLAVGLVGSALVRRHNRSLALRSSTSA